MGIAKMAGSTVFRMRHAWIVIQRTHFKDFRGAKLYTDMASFAPGGVNGYFPARLVPRLKRMFLLPNRSNH